MNETQAKEAAVWMAEANDVPNLQVRAMMRKDQTWDVGYAYTPHNGITKVSMWAIEGKIPDDPIKRREFVMGCFRSQLALVGIESNV